jgi:ABC-type iron transport system FetAB permease component
MGSCGNHAMLFIKLTISYFLSDIHNVANLDYTNSCHVILDVAMIDLKFILEMLWMGFVLQYCMGWLERELTTCYS